MDSETDKILEEEILEDEDDSIPFDPICRAKFLKHEELDDINPVRDIKWVYGALGVSGLKQSDAPSPSAWRLLHELEDDLALLKAFYAGPFSKLLIAGVKTEKENDRVDDDREEFRLIGRLLREPDDLAPVLNDLEGRARKLASERTYSKSGV